MPKSPQEPGTISQMMTVPPISLRSQRSCVDSFLDETYAWQECQAELTYQSDKIWAIPFVVPALSYTV